jgi:hypothetical protein
MLKGFLRKGRMFQSDSDKSPAAGAAPVTPPATEADPVASGAPKPEAEGSGQTFTQADVDRIVQERLTRAQNKAKADADKAKSEAEQAALQQQGEWKTLAEQREAKIKELEPLATQLEEAKADAAKYRKAIAKYAEQQAASVPESVKLLLKNVDPIDQLEWLSTNAPSLTPAPIVGTPRNGTGQKPAPATAPKPDEPRRVVKF